MLKKTTTKIENKENFMEITNMIAELKNSLEEMEDKIEVPPKKAEQNGSQIENRKEK